MKCKPANPIIYQRQGMPVFWTGWRGPTFGNDGATGQDVRDITRNVPAGTRSLGCTWADGTLGKSLYVDGNTGSHCRFPADPVFDCSFALTITARVRMDVAVAGGMGIVERDLSSAPYGISFRQSYSTAGKFEFSIGTAAGNVNGDTAVSSTTLQIGAWYHLAATYDGYGIRLYVNGALDATNAFNGGAIVTTSGTQVTIGDGTFYANRVWTGMIDDVRWYSDRALSPAQIAREYADPYWRLRKPRRTSVFIFPKSYPSLLLTC